MKYLKDFILNKHPGQTAFGLHRISGIILTFYLLLHIMLHSTALLFGNNAYNAVANRLDKPLAHLFEIFIIIIASFHSLNGIRLILIDVFLLTRFQKELYFAVRFLTAFIGIYSLSIYFERLF
ncbi:MAG: succinate dehydrogenase, cytochrome b556 subunit [Nitrospirae bacterium]|nr:succinate dehydrogenase, cytochrome b556 subunit [Nitrospirota bacterium]